MNDASRNRNLHDQNMTRNQRFPRIYPFIITISLIPVLFMLLELYLSQSQYSSSNTLLFQDLFVDNNTDTADTNSEQYLLYFSHSGFSNQLRGLQGAVRLALVTNRTLVLPPPLYHTHRPIERLFPILNLEPGRCGTIVEHGGITLNFRNRSMEMS